MISTILLLSFTSSTATSAKPPAFARCASWLILLASPASLRMVSASCLFNPGYDLCRNNRLPDILTDTQPGFPGSLLDGVILQLGQLRADYLFCLSAVFLPDDRPACPVSSSCLLLLGGILEIATNGSGFLCGKQSKVVSVYRNITLLSKLNRQPLVILPD